MLVKPKYYIKEEAPMKYYSILRVLIVFWCINGAARVATSFADENVLYTVELSIGLILQIAAAVGLNQMKRSGVLFLYAVFSFVVVDVILALSIYSYLDAFDSSVLSQAIMQIIGALIWGIPSFIYFERRRPLFIPYIGYNHTIMPLQNVEITKECENHFPDLSDTVHKKQVKFCNKCGFELFENSDYCSNCGIKLTRSN